MQRGMGPPSSNGDDGDFFFGQGVGRGHHEIERLGRETPLQDVEDFVPKAVLDEVELSRRPEDGRRKGPCVLVGDVEPGPELGFDVVGALAEPLVAGVVVPSTVGWVQKFERVPVQELAVVVDEVNVDNLDLTLVQGSEHLAITCTQTRPRRAAAGGRAVARLTMGPSKLPNVLTRSVAISEK